MKKQKAFLSKGGEEVDDRKRKYNSMTSSEVREKKKTRTHESYTCGFCFALFRAVHARVFDLSSAEVYVDWMECPPLFFRFFRHVPSRGGHLSFNCFSRTC